MERRKHEAYSPRGIAAKLDKILPDFDELLKAKWFEIPFNVKLAFFVSVFFTLLIHGYMFFNKFVSEDGLFGIYRPNAYSYFLGRWAIEHFTTMRGNYVIPWVIGVMVLLYLAVSISITVYLLETKSKIFTVLTSLLMTAMPSLAWWFSYDFLADIVPAAIMLSSVSVFLTKKYKYGFLPGAVVLMVSLATYQALLGFAAGLSVILIIKFCLKESYTTKAAYLYLGRFVLLGAIGVLIYLVSVQISLFFGTLELAGHAGVDAMGRVQIGSLPSLVRTAYLDFFRFFTIGNRFSYVSLLQSRLYMIVAASILILFFYIIVVKKLHRQLHRLGILLFMFLALPLSLNIIVVLAPDNLLRLINMYQLVLVIILAFALIEIAQEQGKPLFLTKLTKYAVSLSVLLIAWHFWMLSGQFYFMHHMNYERTFAFYNRILARIEETEGFRGDLPLAFLGNYTGVSFRRSSEQFPNVTISSQFIGQFVGAASIEPFKPRNFIDHYLGVNFTLASPEQFDRVLSNPELWVMPIWPHSGSVAVIDGVIVVKLAEQLAGNVEITIEQIDGSLHRIGSSVSFPDDFLFVWYIYRDGEKIDSTQWTVGLSSIYVEFTERAGYSFAMFVRTSEGRWFIPAVHSAARYFAP